MAEHTAVIGLWEKIRIFCINHDTPQPMKIVKNTELIKTPFYACGDYINLDEGKHDCANRLNLDDYQGIVLKFFDMYEEDPLKNYTGTAFTFKGARQKIYVRVIKQSDSHIDLGIKNLTVLK
ncbi:MAG: hypothetical protein ACI4CS_00830 [Candidatus Weimeria sp.]